MYFYAQHEAVVTVREAMNRPRRKGCAERPGKGAHVLQKGGCRIVVSNHTGNTSTGTLRTICTQAGWEYPPQR